MTPRARRILREVLSLPTAPFREHRVIAWARRFAEHRKLPFRQDEYGNVFIDAPPRRKGRRPPWVFAAHMDHPGFVAFRQRGASLWAEFRGGVKREFFRGSRVRFFAPSGDVRATVETLPRKTRGRPGMVCRIRLAAPADVPPGTIGMWDLPPCRITPSRVSARACDDLCGVAAVLCAVDMLARADLDTPVTALLTRAEEAGFIGALAACEGTTLPTDARIVAIETSAAQPGARLGDGVVIRAGDRSRTYDPAMTAHLVAVAAKLAQHDRNFHSVYRLMPGGTCEATPYCLSGRAATGLCLPLGNYHNMGGSGRIAPSRFTRRISNRWSSCWSRWRPIPEPHGTLRRLSASVWRPCWPGAAAS